MNESEFEKDDYSVYFDIVCNVSVQEAWGEMKDELKIMIQTLLWF